MASDGHEYGGLASLGSVAGIPRVLVIDDHTLNRSDLTRALQLAGFDVTGVGSADARAAVGEGFDVAIVDLMLHGTNGFELARMLRREVPFVRVVLTSDYHFSAMQLERMNCGAVGFVPRPCALDELADFLRSKISLPPPALESGA